MESGKERYISPSKGELSVAEVVNEIKDFVNAGPDSSYLVVIGSDSQAKHVNNHSEIDFVTAIIVHRQGKGARYFYRKEKSNMAPILRAKIYTETQMSLEAANQFAPLLRQAINPAKYDLEIHVDVGPFGPTREMIKEVTGMVQGNGYKAKTKPESWGASTVADKHT